MSDHPHPHLHRWLLLGAETNDLTMLRRALTPAALKKLSIQDFQWALSCAVSLDRVDAAQEIICRHPNPLTLMIDSKYKSPIKEAIANANPVMINTVLDVAFSYEPPSGKAAEWAHDLQDMFWMFNYTYCRQSTAAPKDRPQLLECVRHFIDRVGPTVVEGWIDQSNISPSSIFVDITLHDDIQQYLTAAALAERLQEMTSRDHHGPSKIRKI